MGRERPPDESSAPELEIVERSVRHLSQGVDANVRWKLARLLRGKVPSSVTNS
jgi:hypothetical protein